MHINWTVVAFSIAVTAIAGVASALLPARNTTRRDGAVALTASAGRYTQPLRMHSVFVTAEIALSVLLAICALLLARSARNASEIDPGFAVEGIEVVGVDLQLGGYDPPRGRAFADALIARIDALPGLEGAATARVVPLTGEREGGRAWLPEEYGNDRAIDGSQNIVSPAYFRTLGIPLIAGRRNRGDLLDEDLTEYWQRLPATGYAA